MTASVVSRAAGLGALSAAGQLIIIGSLPAYSRLFDPGTYGQYLIFVGAAGVVSVFAGIRYDSAIVLPRNDRIAGMLTAVVMAIAVVVAALIAGATVLSGKIAWAPARWLASEPEFGYGLAAATVIGAAQRCYSSWCIRGGHFLSMGFGLFIFSLVTVVAQLTLARVTGQSAALVWGYVCALVLQTVCLAVATWRDRRPGWKPHVSGRGMKIAAYKYRRFPTYMVGYALASSVRDRLIQIMLGIGAGAAVVGRFGLAYRVSFAPNSLIYNSVSPIFFSIASRGTRVSVGRFAASLVEAAIVVLAVPYAAFALEAPAMTDGLLAEKWHGTGPFFQALAGPALLLAATCWLDRAFDSFRRQRVAFCLEAGFTLVSVGLVGYLSRLVDAVEIAWIYGAVAIAYYWIYFLTTFIACEFPMHDFRRACLTGTLAILAAVGLGSLAHQVPSIIIRVIAYVLLMALLVVMWMKFRGGADTLRLLMRSRVGTTAVEGLADAQL
jgi:O-antigen/teichoic acid export membrane protein